MRGFRVAVLVSMFIAAASFAAETNTLPTTITVDGVTYSNIMWHNVTPATVSIMHATGAVSIPLDKLPPELQRQFGYDPKKAAEYRAAERSAEAARQEALRKLRAKEAAERQRQAQEDAEKQKQAAEAREKQAKVQLEAAQRLAARAESISMLCLVGRISPLSTNHYVAQLTLVDQTTVCVYFDESGKRYLEDADRVFGQWKTRHDAQEQHKRDEAQPRSQPVYIGGRLTSVLTPGSEYNYTEQPAPVTAVYGVREANSCYSLIGSQQITQTGGFKQYSW